MMVWLGFFVAAILQRGCHAQCGGGANRTQDAIQDNDIEQNVTFKCPYVSTCLYDQDAFLTTSDNDDNGTTQSCCRPCGPAHICKMECCTDIMPCTLPTATPSGGEMVCIPVEFVNQYKHHEDGILAIATCKEGSAKTQKAMCLQKYDINTVSPLDIVPITDSITFKVYRNVHCALCNGLQTNDVRYWSLNVFGLGFTNMASFSEILENSRVSYRNPYPDMPTPRCNFRIHICDAGLPAGIIQVSNIPGTKELCEESPDDVSKYVQRDNTIFKNIHCFHCNGFVYGAKSLQTWTSFFSVVVGVEGFQMYITKTSTGCSSGMVSLQQKGRCVNARCSMLRHLHDSSCKRTVQLVESFSYKIMFRIKFDAQLEISTAYGLAEQIGELVDTFLLSVFNTITDVKYQAVLIADTQLHDQITTAEVVNANLLWIEIQTALRVDTPHDPEERLQSLLSKDSRFTLSIDGKVHYITLMVKDGLYDKYEKSLFTYCATEFIVFDSCLDINESSFTTNLIARDNFTLVPFYGNKIDKIISQRNILAYRECVFVPVQKANTSWQDTGNGIQFTTTGVFLSFSEFIYGESDDVIWVCLETYHALHNYGPRTSPIAYIYLFSHLLLCAAKHLLSL